MPSCRSLLDVQLLRFVREHGTNERNIERRYRKALEWKASSLPPLQASYPC